MPEELIAIPVIESGYRNLPQSSHESWGAGIWMFIKSTARNYGLKVNDQVDERLNPELLTDAAMRLLIANRARFDDWQLSVLAYSAGESHVQKAIDQTGSRDPWKIIQAGIGDEPDYLPKLMATILIMKNPHMLD